ncbi:MAG: hypothetical protein ACREIQ_01400 [Nitrospiria bacterium]
MIFSQTHAWLTSVSPHTGLPKTQTRRLPNPEYIYRCQETDGRRFLTEINRVKGTIIAIYVLRAWHIRSVYEVGHTYAIQPGRGKKAVGRFRLASIRVERPGDIAIVDAQAEGCRDIEHYRRLWNEIHPDTKWESNPKVIVLEMEPVL